MASEIKVNKITTSSGSTLEFGGAGDTVSVGSGATVAGFGKVLQIVTATKTDKFTTTSTTFTDVTGLSVSITPSSSSNKILVQAVVNGASSQGTSTSRNLIGLFRDSTQIALGDSAGSRTRTSFDLSTRLTGSDNLSLSGTVIFLDSPSATSSITYAIKAVSPLGGTLAINGNYVDDDTASNSRSISTITLMEIDA